MPSTSRAQHAFMAMSRSPEGRARLNASGKTPAPVNVAQEFVAADKGRKFPRAAVVKALMKGRSNA